jgi:hypothetical protein
MQLRDGLVGRFSQRVLVRAHNVGFAFDAHVFFPEYEVGSTHVIMAKESVQDTRVVSLRGAPATTQSRGGRGYVASNAIASHRSQ